MNKTTHSNKILLIIFFILILSSHSLSLQKNSIDIRKATANLKIRNLPNLNGKKIGLIPKGSFVQVFEEIGKEINILGKNGKWCIIHWENIIGYSFDGYLIKKPNVKKYKKYKLNRYQDLIESIEINPKKGPSMNTKSFWWDKDSRGIGTNPNLELLDVKEQEFPRFRYLWYEVKNMDNETGWFIGKIISKNDFEQDFYYFSNVLKNYKSNLQKQEKGNPIKLYSFNSNKWFRAKYLPSETYKAFINIQNRNIFITFPYFEFGGRIIFVKKIKSSRFKLITIHYGRTEEIFITFYPTRKKFYTELKNAKFKAYFFQ